MDDIHSICALDAYSMSARGELMSTFELIREHAAHGCLAVRARLRFLSTIEKLRGLGFKVEVEISATSLSQFAGQSEVEIAMTIDWDTGELTTTQSMVETAVKAFRLGQTVVADA